MDNNLSKMDISPVYSIIISFIPLMDNSGSDKCINLLLTPLPGASIAN